MKKLLLAAALVLLTTTAAFAAGNNSGADQTGSLTVGGSNDSGGTATDKMTCGLSNDVHAVYYTDGTATEPAQWFSIGTYHLGGSEVYGTAQDITSLYKLKEGKTPGKKFTWSGLPEASTTSSNVWSANWEQL